MTEIDMLDFKALLFDLDGTLLDTAPDFISAINIQLSRHGRAPLPDHAIRNTVTNGSAGIIQNAFGTAPNHPNFEHYREEFLALYLANIADRTRLFEGLQQVLDNCIKHAIPWGIVTNKPWKYTEALLNQLNLAAQSATTICPDHVAHPKPDPESLFLACSELSVNPEDCIFIGDHIRDIQTGRNAGMRTIAAAWGYIDESENIADWQADWTVEKSADLNSLLFL